MEPRKTLETARNFLFLFLMLISEISGSDWNYKGNLGPNFWHQLFPDCSGRKQSPINIFTQDTVYDPTLTEFAIWFNPPHPQDHMIVINNGHTVKVKTIGKFYIANGGLPNVYKTAQLHFHWGLEDYQGSEHQIDSASYPMELHIVNYDHHKYSSLSEAMTKPLGLAVLGVMFKVTEEDNPALKPIIDVFEEIQKPGHPKMKINAQSIRVFLPKDTSKFYRYNGSLTTPGCYETVIWTIFKQANYISHGQIKKLRELFYNKEFGGHPHHKHHHHNHDKLIEGTQATLLAIENQEISPVFASTDNQKKEDGHKGKENKNPTKPPRQSEISVKNNTELTKLDQQPHLEQNHKAPNSEIQSDTTKEEAKLEETANSKDKSSVAAAKEDAVAPNKEEEKLGQTVISKDETIIVVTKEDAVTPNKEEPNLKETVISKDESVVVAAEEDVVTPNEEVEVAAIPAILVDQLPKETSEATNLKPQVTDQKPQVITDKEKKAIPEMQRDASYVQFKVSEQALIGRKRRQGKLSKHHRQHHHPRQHHVSKRHVGGQATLDDHAASETKKDVLESSIEETDYLVEGDKKVDMIEEEIHKSDKIYEDKLKIEAHKIERINIIDNYRPIQPLNDRIVLRSFKSFEDKKVLFSGDGVQGQQPDYVQSKAETKKSSATIICVMVIITFITNLLSLA